MLSLQYVSRSLVILVIVPLILHNITVGRSMAGRTVSLITERIVQHTVLLWRSSHLIPDTIS